MGKFPQRKLEVIIAEICKDNKIKLISSSDGWILELIKNNKSMFIYGYNFPNNNAAAEKICNDKSGLSNILEYKNIPTFKYYFFMNKYFEFSEIKKIFNQNNNDVVIKPNNGTAGNDVYRCKTLASLKKYVDFIDTHYASFVVSKFYNYENEYRVIIYNQEIFTIYKKQRQGDWRHNLGLGAIPNETIAANIKKKLVNLALNATKAIGINFCSVDIAELSLSDYKIVEINSGVMLEKYSLLNPKNARKIYETPIKEYFKI